MRRWNCVAAISACLTGISAQAALIGHWNFNGQVNDQAGAADGVATDVAFVASGAGVGGAGLGEAGIFNGDTSGVAFGSGSHPASFDLGTGDFTIAGWLRTPTNTATGGGGNRPVFQNISYSGGGWILEIGRADRSYAGKAFFTVGGGSADVFGKTQVFSDTRLDDDAWHWIAIVNDDGALRMYVDGVLQTDTGSLVAGTSTATAPPAVEAAFAKAPSVTPFAGQLDEWTIHDEALSGVLSGNTLTGGELYELWQVPEPASVSLLAAGLFLALRPTRRRFC